MSIITKAINAAINAICSTNLKSPKRLATIGAAAVMLVAYWPLHSVPTGSRGVITQWGAIQGVAGEGPVLLWPWQKLSVFNVRAHAAEVNNAEGSTFDTQPVKVSMTVRYSIATNRVSDVYEQYSHDGDLSSYIDTATQEVFKAVTAKYTATELIGQRAKVSEQISAALKVKVAPYGAQIINIDMRSFSFSKDYMDAIAEKVKQEQLRLGAENKLKTVEAEQKQKVAIAEAEASAARASADGEAYAQLTVAKAQAEAMRIQSQAMAQGREVLELKRIEVDLEKAKRWNGQLPTNMYGSAPIPFLNAVK